MPEVDFHTGLSDLPGYACRLLRKAWRQGRQIVVTGPSEQLQRLDTLLWTFDPDDFVPHARLRPGSPIAEPLRRTPIWLAEVAEDAPPRDVLVNLGPDWVEAGAAFARVIELVGALPDAVDDGRRRWRQYLAAGITPTRPQSP